MNKTIYINKLLRPQEQLSEEECKEKYPEIYSELSNCLMVNFNEELIKNKRLKGELK